MWIIEIDDSTKSNRELIQEAEAQAEKTLLIGRKDDKNFDCLKKRKGLVLFCD